MALEQELKLHPKGQVSINGSQMMQATMGRFSSANGGKLTHTLARSPNGFVMGVREGSGSFEFEVAEDGLEADWIGLVRTGQLVPFQYEIPTLSCEITGAVVSVDFDIPVDGAVKGTCSWVGKIGTPVQTA